jgi:hypothetical protein
VNFFTVETETGETELHSTECIGHRRGTHHKRRDALYNAARIHASGVAAVPEPASLVLFGTGALVMAK